MRVLVIGAEQKQQLADLVKHAESNVFSMDDMFDVHNGDMKTPGDMDGFSCDIPVGYKVVFTIEKHPSMKVRHTSISVDTPGKLPLPQCVEMIIKELGFTKPMLECMVDIEKVSDTFSAISVREFIA